MVLSNAGLDAYEGYALLCLAAAKMQSDSVKCWSNHFLTQFKLKFVNEKL